MARTQIHTITSQDVGKSTLRVRGKKINIADAIGPVQAQDIGKRVFDVKGVIQVENNQQLQKRIAAQGTVLLQGASGKWSFAGNVPAGLAFVTREGKKPTEKQLADAKQVGPGIVGLTVKTFRSRAAAQIAANRLGVRISQILPRSTAVTGPLGTPLSTPSQRQMDRS